MDHLFKQESYSKKEMAGCTDCHGSCTKSCARQCHASGRHYSNLEEYAKILM